MTTITVMGPIAVEDSGPALAPRDRVVLSVLVARRGQEVTADTLAEALWGEHPPASAHKVVQGCIARLRRRLGAGAIVTGRSSYRLVVPADEVDASRFEQLVQRARELYALGHADQAAYAAGEALSLWRGRALGELEDWEPGRGEAQRLTELRLLAEELHLDALLASGRHEEALAEAAARVREEPLREHRWALLARAQYQDEQQAEALATLRRARQVLADELGLDPEWRYLPVRRLALFVRRSLEAGLRWAVLEPMRESTWARVRAACETFLVDLWRRGAFPGRVPSEAFSVRCGRDTMTLADIAAGRLVVAVGIAPLRPDEFTVLRLELRGS